MIDIKKEIKEYIQSKMGKDLPISFNRLKASLDPLHKDPSINQIVIAEEPPTRQPKANQCYDLISIGVKHTSADQAHKVCTDIQNSLVQEVGGRIVENGTNFARIILRQKARFIGYRPTDNSTGYECQLEFIYKDDEIYSN